MLHASPKLGEAISKVTELNTFHQSSFTHMNFRGMVKLISSKYDQVTIWQTYSPNHYQLQHLRR